jgi:hypothetical protein
VRRDVEQEPGNWRAGAGSGRELIKSRIVDQFGAARIEDPDTVAPARRLVFCGLRGGFPREIAQRPSRLLPRAWSRSRAIERNAVYSLERIPCLAAVPTPGQPA